MIASSCSRFVSNISSCLRAGWPKFSQHQNWGQKRERTKRHVGSTNRSIRRLRALLNCHYFFLRQFRIQRPRILLWFLASFVSASKFNAKRSWSQSDRICRYLCNWIFRSCFTAIVFYIFVKLRSKNSRWNILCSSVLFRAIAFQMFLKLWQKILKATLQRCFCIMQERKIGEDKRKWEKDVFCSESASGRK